MLKSTGKKPMTMLTNLQPLIVDLVHIAEKQVFVQTRRGEKGQWLVCCQGYMEKRSESFIVQYNIDFQIRETGTFQAGIQSSSISYLSEEPGKLH